MRPHRMTTAVDHAEHLYDAQAQQRRVIMWLIASFLGGALIINAFIAGWAWSDTPEIGSISAFFGAIFLASPVVYNAVRDLIRGKRHMNELVALAIIACFALGDYKTAGLVAFFMLLADLVQHRTALGARQSIEGLVRLAPTRARLLQNGEEREVEAAVLRPGNRIRLRPGDNVPADGVIREGQTSLNEATITGESVPADKGPDDQVFAGTVNLTGALEVEVTRAGQDTTLGRVRDMILQAEQTRLPIMRIIDHYVKWYTPVVIMIAAIIWFFTKHLGPDVAAFRAITAIVFTCPCAFILATPTAMIAALSCSARLGILVKNVADLESAGKISAICFDKTGTLTTGRLAVTRLAPNEGVEPAELLKVAASAERHSNHPVAHALLTVAGEAKLDLSEPTDVSEVAGKGVTAQVSGSRVLVGRDTWLREQGVAHDSFPEVADAETQGVSTLYVAKGGRCLGWVGLEDKARPEARRAADDLKDLGVRQLTMFTGDRWSVARKVSSGLGCTHVEAECLPERKLQLVHKMQDSGHLVAVVGDGVNDAPALAAGDISVAMGAAGSDIAIHSANIALMSNDLGRLPFLIRLSRKARRVINQNLLFGLIFIVGGLTLSGFGYATPTLAAVLHNIGSFIVIFNSARLVRFGEELKPFLAAEPPKEVAPAQAVA